MYTYALLKTSTEPLTLPAGLVNSLQILGNPTLSALVEPDFDLAAIQQDDDRLIQAVLHHDRVLQTMFLQTTILPLRFGTRFASQDDLLTYLTYHETTYVTKLAELQGKAEYTLKFLALEISSSEPADWSNLKGRDYFLAKKQHYQAQQLEIDQQAAELVQLQQTIAQAYPNAIFPDAQDVNSRCFVLASQATDALLEQVLIWQKQVFYWQIQLSEALPPYHFV